MAPASPAAPAPSSDAAAHRRGALASWNWRASAGPSAPPPPRRRLAVQGAIGIAIGLILLAAHSPKLGTVALVLSSTSLLLALLAPPRWIHGMHRGVELFGAGVGKVMTVIVLSSVYFLFFLPVGILSRGKSTARFQRVLEPQRETYWRKRTGGPTQSERQF